MHYGKYVQSCHRIENNILNVNLDITSIGHWYRSYQNMFKNILHIKQNKERLLIAKK